MPTTIPYDPSLTLTSVVNENALKNVEQIAAVQAPVNAAQDALNSLISSKHSLRMTKTELANLGVDTAPLEEELKKLGDTIGKAAADYAKAKMAAEPQIQKLRQSIRMVHSSVESPVDYTKTEIKPMALAADTMNMDVQYFSFDHNSQNAVSYSNQIAAYVSKTQGSVFGPSQSFKVGAAASSQVSRQVKTHSIEGTLVLSVACTHKNASILAPFTLHVDKAIKVWNHLFPSKKFDPTSQSSMMKVAMNESQEDKAKFSIISGTTFGSSFVGMVHILNTTNTTVGETLAAGAANLQASMSAGSWFAHQEGKVGVDRKFAMDVKSLLSQQNVTSHVTLLTTGVIPSIVASSVANSVEKFEKFDPQTHMAQLAVIQNATSADRASIESMAEASRTGAQSTEIEGRKIEATLSTLAAIDDSRNKVLDTNTMMTALDDYLKKAAEGSAGVPINYYLKHIDQKMLAQMWVAKYYPGKYMAIKYDDSDGAGPAADESAKAKL